MTVEVMAELVRREIATLVYVGSSPTHLLEKLWDAARRAYLSLLRLHLLIVGYGARTLP